MTSGNLNLAVRVLTTLAELDLENPQYLRYPLALLSHPNTSETHETFGSLT